MTGQEGGTKQQVSNIIGQDSVTTQCGLMVRQRVEPIPVWWFRVKRSSTYTLLLSKLINHQFRKNNLEENKDTYLQGQSGPSSQGSWT